MRARRRLGVSPYSRVRQEQAFAGHENPGAEAGVVERLAGRVLRRQFLPPHRAKAREAEAEEGERGGLGNRRSLPRLDVIDA